MHNYKQPVFVDFDYNMTLPRLLEIAKHIEENGSAVEEASKRGPWRKSEYDEPEKAGNPMGGTGPFVEDNDLNVSKLSEIVMNKIVSNILYVNIRYCV